MQIVNDSPKLIGKGYASWWHTKKLYRVNKGGRASKKSCNTALWFIWNMMKYFHEFNVKPNTLVIRRYWNTHKDSTRAQLVWAINRLGVAHLWNIPKSELTLTYKPSGQQILFRGLDDPESITSITVVEGHLCWTWWEEAFQAANEEIFDKIDMSIRGDMPDPLFIQHTLTLNPWSDKHWIKRRFFDLLSKEGKPLDGEDIFTVTTTFEQNEFLGEKDRKRFKDMEEHSPKRYWIEGLGNWGIAEGLIFTNWEQEDFDINELIENQQYRGLYGLDFGYNDPTAFVALRHKKGEFKLYLYDEFYQSTMSNQKIANSLIEKGFRSSLIKADSEDPRTINELKILGLLGIRGAKKGAGSVIGGLQKLEDYKIIVHPRCINTITALNNYAWQTDKKTGAILNIPDHDFSHIPDAIRYATEDLNKRYAKFA